MGEENMKFRMVGPDGEEKECEILFTFRKDDTRDFMVYTDHTRDPEGNSRVYAAFYEPDSPEQKLFPIETEEDWALVEFMLQQVSEQVAGGEQETP